MNSTPVRTKEEAMEVCADCTDHEEMAPGELAHLSFEAGVRAAIRWMYYSSEPHPLDVKPTTRPEATVVYSEPDKL